jgi:hypothetical protein
MNTKYTFMVDGEAWTPAQIEELEYQRGIFCLHSLKRHGIKVADGACELSDDEIDYLSMADVKKVSLEARSRVTGEAVIDAYRDSFRLSDSMWKELGFSQEKAMKVSHCDIEVDGMTLPQFMEIMKRMQADKKVALAAHPEHFHGIVTDDKILCVEPFGMYGTPTLCRVDVLPIDRLGPRIREDIDPECPVSQAGRAFLMDGVTEINSPFHQYKPLENGFIAKTAVYWPEGTPDEIVHGHSLHLAVEFYNGLKLSE